MRRRTKIAALFGVCAVISAIVVERWIARAPLPEFTPAVSQVVLDREGALLRAYTVEDGLWRLPVSAAAVDQGYLAQLIAYEDKRFWSHPGVDFIALARAGFSSLLAGEIVSGGSTLTMQVARLLEDAPTGSPRAKLRQIRLSLAMERRFSKDEILDLYLQLAPFGGNIEGVRAASLSYFGKEPARLSPGQAALLVAIPQSPNARRPDRFPDRARDARARVLERAVKRDALSRDIADEAAREPMPRMRRSFPQLAPHLADRLVAGGTGPQHHTTLDKSAQIALEKLLRDRAAKLAPGLSIALIAVEHHSGAVAARLGSPGLDATERGGYLDLSRSVRSPGSTLKPLIFGLTFEQGFGHPETLIDDRPMEFSGYAPTNFDSEYHGTLSIRSALQRSRNVPAVAALEAVGPARLLSRMRRAGADPKLPDGEAPGLAIALGGVGATLEGLVKLYGSIARGGRAMPFHERAVAPGDLAPNAARVLDAKSAWYVGDILAGVPAPDNALNDNIAFKTGTSYGNRDAWAVGFDGTHTIGVWVGRPDGGAARGITGIGTAAPLLFSAFSRLKSVADPLPEPPAEVLRVSNAELPKPLRRFRARGRARVEAHGPGPRIIYPPDGAVLEVGYRAEETLVPLKLRDGRAPFSVLVDGRKIDADPFAREIFVEPDGPGFLNISVVDARGRSARASVRID